MVCWQRRMDMRRMVAGLVLALAGPALFATERAPMPPRPLPAESGEARVIVQFKPSAAVMRRLSLGPAQQRNLAAEVQALHQRAAQLGGRAGVALASGSGISDRSQVVAASGITSAALAARLAQDPEVEFAMPDQRMRRTRVPNDPLYLSGGAAGPESGQWYLRPTSAAPSAINAEQAWDLSTGDPSIVVAVLDTGVRFDHADLAGKLLPGYDFITDPDVANDGNARDADASDPGDWVTAAEVATPKFADCEESNSSWHGTMVAGLVAAATDNGVGMAGTGWSIRVLPVRVLGKCFGRSSDIIAGMRWAAGIAVPGVPDNPSPAKVVNLSLGGEGGCSAEYENAISELVARGVIVVAAAGNTAGRAVSRPANCPGAIGVAALRHIGTKVGFSDLGPEITIAAPGGNCVNLSGACLFPILTTSNAGTTAPVAGSSIYTDASNVSVGTSFSSPLVAGTVGLMASLRPAITQAEVRSLLQATARAFPFRGAPDDTSGPVVACVAPTTADQLQCYCATGLCGAGMLDARGAVAATIGLLPRIGVAPAAPSAAESVTLSGAATELPAGRSVVSYSWTLVDDGGIVSGFTSATNADTATLVPSAAGRFIVRLAVTDDAGLTSAAETTVTVAAAPVPTSAPAPAGGGGGAMDAAALLMLAVATALLRLKRW